MRWHFWGNVKKGKVGSKNLHTRVDILLCCFCWQSYIYSYIVVFFFSSLAAFKIFVLSLLLSNLIIICLVVFLTFLMHAVHWAFVFVDLIFQQIWKAFSHYLFKYFSTPLSFGDFNYMHIRLLDGVPKLTDTLLFFLCSVLSQWFILNKFYCYVFKHTNLFFWNILSAIYPIQYILKS